MTFANMEISPRLWRLLAVVQGCFNMAATGSCFVFNAYSNALKATFHLHQSQVSLAATLVNFGFNTAFPAAFLLEKVGPRVVSICGLLLNVSVHLGLWYATGHADNVHGDLFYVVQILFFILGFGASFANMSAMITNVKNHASSGGGGKVVGFMEASQSAGPAVIALIYSAMFVNGHNADPENQNLAGYFLAMALAYLVIHLSAIAFLNNIPDGVSYSQCDSYDDESGNLEINPILKGSGCQAAAPCTVRELLSSGVFHLILWPFLISSAVQFMFITNITMYLRSFDLIRFNSTFVILIPTVGAIVKLAIGFISDRFIKTCPRIVWMLLGNTLQTVACTIFVKFPDQIVVLFIVICAVMIANSITWCLIPVTLTELYGAEFFGRVWGYIVFAYSLATFGMQALFAYNYQMHTSSSQEIYCYGDDCYSISSVVACICSLLACCGNILVLYDWG